MSRPLPKGIDLSRALETRMVQEGTISYGGKRYMLVDSDGIIWDPGNGTKTGVHVNRVTEETCAERNLKRFALEPR